LNTPEAEKHVSAASAYFSELDSGRIPSELFAPGFEFYFPKFGVGQGLEELQEFAMGLAGAGLTNTHHRDRLVYHACGSMVVVEGTTYGHDTAGGSWDGGSTPGGRFCSVFDFDDAGLIKRMYVYMDPDFTGSDRDRFRWTRTGQRW
jgi:hypothetical protein